MNRGLFFRWLLFGGASLVTGKIGGAAPLPAPEPGSASKARDIYLDSLCIAGFQYYEGLDREEYLEEGYPLILKRQCENPHDFFAVEVYQGDYKLGYLPRSDNRVIARMMDQGIKVKAIVRSIDPDTHPFRRVRIRVYSEVGARCFKAAVP